MVEVCLNAGDEKSRHESLLRPPRVHLSLSVARWRSMKYWTRRRLQDKECWSADASACLLCIDILLDKQEVDRVQAL